MNIDAAEAMEVLAEKGFLLRQSAPYLPKEQCGGTCASTTSINNLLVLAEAVKPGARNKESSG